MSDYIAPASVTRLEREIAELERQFGQPETQEEEVLQEGGVETLPPQAEQPPETQEVTQPELDPDEETFKKRYSDLRRHSQKLADELAEVRRLNEELKSQKTGANLPSAEEAEEWVKANPKAAGIIKAIMTEGVQTTSRELEEIKSKLSRAEEEAKIKKAHPDFEEITGDEGFHNWADKQPESVKSLIFSSKAEDVIWAVSYYKDSTQKKQPNEKREAAKPVSPKTSSVELKAEGKGRFSESKVSKMSLAEYAANEDAIAEEIRNGTFVYDLSGAAR